MENKIHPNHIEAAEYVRSHLKAGYSEEQIKRHLADNGWDEPHISHAFFLAGQKGNRTLSSQSKEHKKSHKIESEVSEAQKLKVFYACQEAFRLLRKNKATFIVAVLLSLVFSIIIFIPILIVTAVFIAGTISQSGDISSILRTLTVLLLISISLGSIWQALSISITQIVTALTLFAGKNGERVSVNDIMNSSFKKLVKVSKVNLLISFIMYWPLILLVVGLPFVSGTISNAAIIYPLATLLFTIWLIIALLRYSLAPFVAIFEPEISVRKSLKQSRKLLEKGGQWFLIKLGLLAISISIVVIFFGSLLGTGSVNEIADGNNIFINLILIALGIGVHSVLAVLYLNRIKSKNQNEEAKRS